MKWCDVLLRYKKNNLRTSAGHLDILNPQFLSAECHRQKPSLRVHSIFQRVSLSVVAYKTLGSNELWLPFKRTCEL